MADLLDMDFYAPLRFVRHGVTNRYPIEGLVRARACVSWDVTGSHVVMKYKHTEDEVLEKRYGQWVGNNVYAIRDAVAILIGKKPQVSVIRFESSALISCARYYTETAREFKLEVAIPQQLGRKIAQFKQAEADFLAGLSDS